MSLRLASSALRSPGGASTRFAVVGCGSVAERRFAIEHQHSRYRRARCALRGGRPDAPN